MNARPRCHLAFPVLAEARAFTKDLPGCRERRSSEAWVDFDFFGHVAHLSPNETAHKAYNRVDGDVRYFGVILTMDEQAMFFIQDASGNALEFKAFHDETRVFAQ